MAKVSGCAKPVLSSSEVGHLILPFSPARDVQITQKRRRAAVPQEKKDLSLKQKQATALIWLENMWVTGLDKLKFVLKSEVSVQI